MEIRRIEGVYLQQISEQSQALRAQRVGEELRIKTLSSVLEVLMELFSEGRPVKAEVLSVEGDFLDLLFEGGFRTKAENRSSVKLLPGDVLELAPEPERPTALKVKGLYRKGPVDVLLTRLFEVKEEHYISISTENLQEDVENSGVFYERKLLDWLLGKTEKEALFKDQKAKLLVALSEGKEGADRLEFINNLQLFALQHENTVYLPVYYEGSKGGLAFRVGKDYTVVFRFEYGEGFVAGLMKMPEREKLLDVMLFTDMEVLAQLLSSGRGLLEKMLEEEGIRLRRFSVELRSQEEAKLAIRSFFSEGFLLVV